MSRIVECVLIAILMALVSLIAGCIVAAWYFGIVGPWPL